MSRSVDEIERFIALTVNSRTGVPCTTCCAKTFVALGSE